jgi:hypothetical protein
MTRQEIRRQVLALVSTRLAPGDGALVAHELLVDDLVERMHGDRIVASQVTSELLSVVDTALQRLALQDGVTPGEVWGLMRDDLVLLDILIGERLLKHHGE